MVLSITSALALFALIALSTVVFFASKRFNVPYTVLLVFVGILLIPVVNLPYLKDIFGFLEHMVLTPELLFYIFLPVLLLESGFNMRIRKMMSSAWSISLLAFVSVLVSMFTIAGLLYFIMPYIGVNMPFMVALVFGAIISPTDPVAVLAIFKECGVPRRLSMVFEGESLLNDGTAMALFLIILSVATNGFHGTETILKGIEEFILMVVLGVAFGLFMAFVFSHAVKLTRSNDFVTVTLLLISAHIVFILTEVINESGLVHISPIIATAVTAVFLGNYSRDALAPNVDEYLHKLVEHMAFVVNSLVFLMAGLLFASSGVNFAELWLPIVVTVFVVAFARVVAVYFGLSPLSIFKVEDMPSSWKKLLSWGSLRGALSIIIVMLIPADFTIEGWAQPYSIYEFLLALTIGCILTTLFIKAPLIGPLMRKLDIRESNPLKQAHEADLAVYYLLNECAQLQRYKTKGFLSPVKYDLLVSQLKTKLEDAENKRKELVSLHGIEVFKQSLHLAMIHVEMTSLKRLYINEEVSEKTFRKIYSKLSVYLDKIEEYKNPDLKIASHAERKSRLETFANIILQPLNLRKELTHQQQLEYYRAQMISARKALKAIAAMQTEHGSPVFLTEAYEDVMKHYRRYKDGSGSKADNLVAEFAEELEPYLTKLAHRSLAASGTRAMNYLNENGIVDEHTQHEIRHICAVKL